MDLEKKLKELLTENAKINSKIMELLTYVHNNSSMVNSLSVAQDSNFDILNAINSDLWPAAVNEHLLINRNDEQEKKERGQGIVELYIEESLENKKFLDYGCGEGHVIEAASNVAKFSIGYDIRPFQKWEEINCTNNWDEILKNGPYDVILLFDVLDHLIEENPIDVLKKIKTIMVPNGSLYIRFHPITSRCATHSYHKMNKAFIHLVLNPDEMARLLPNEEDYIVNNGPTKPIKTYEEYIRESGFTIESRNEITEKPEDFFKNPNILKILQNKTGFNEFPEFQMSLNFIDYKLINT